MAAPTIPADWSAVVSPLLDAIEERRRSTALVGLFGSAKGLVLSALAGRLADRKTSVLVVTPTDEAAERLHADVAFFHRAGRRAGRCPVVSGLGRAALRLRAPRRSDRPAHARTGPPPQSGPGARAHRARDGVPATAPAPEPVRRGVFLAEAGGYDRTGSPRHTASASRLPPGVGGGEPRRGRRAGRDRGPVLDGPRRAMPPRIPGRRH